MKNPILAARKSRIAPVVSAATQKVAKAAEFVWRGLFDTEMRISISPGQSTDAKADLRDKYQYLGRNMM